jgi:PDZ domain-containing secreted protein/Zn-dependent protease/CBS domain-containing protein
MESSFRLFRVRGIPIGANWSWLFVFAFLVYSLASDIFPRTYPDLGGGTYLAMAIVGAVLFVASLLLHELGHALRALREGMEIEGITLWLFGGVARFKGMFPSAGAEFRIAIAGPIVSVLLAVAFAVATWLLNLAAAPAAVVGVTFNLARINTILFGFNMIPALPLDGGRVLRSYLWWRQGNFTSATLSATRVARLLAGGLIALGVLQYIQGAGLGGLWFAFIGWFLLQASQAEAAFAHLRQSLRGLHVRDIMTPDPQAVPSGLSARSFIDDVAHLRGHSTYPVIDGDRLVGLVSLRLAATVPPEQRGMKTVRDVMVPLEEVPVVASDAEIVDAMATIRPGPGRAVVVDNDRVVGIVSTADIARALEMERLRGASHDEGLPRRRRRPATWIGLVAIAVVGFGLLYKPPVFVLAPGQAFDVSKDIKVTGVETTKVHGKYLLTSVAVGQPNGIGLLLAMLQSHALLPASSVVPRGVDPNLFFRQQEQLFKETQQVAAAAAARAAGLKVGVTGRGARVIGIVPGSPASLVLREGDVITAIDGKRVRLIDDVGRAIRARPTGARFTLTVRRDGRTTKVTVPSATRVSESGPGIGVYLDLETKLPFKVTFTKRDIGGPSAGLAYALAVYDILESRDLANGRIVATTGTIDLDGRVGPVGGVEEKTVAAKRAGARLFLVPQEEVQGARGTGLDVHGVSTLQDAIDALKA